MATELVNITDNHLSNLKPLFVTDGLKFYAEALLEKYGKLVESPKTGKKGRPRKPAIIPDENLRYAQVIKNKQGSKLQNIEKRVIFGQNIDYSDISTSLLERQNLTFRQDNNRISRKTIGFSKKIKCLYNQIRLYSTYFNFCRDHRGLAKEKQNGVSERKTPAKEAGITKHKWTLTDLLNYKKSKISTN